jgi:ribosome-associated heat shock protein Hsp15
VSEKVVSPKPPAATEVEGVRVDRWLWAARLFKTRSLATKAAAGGHVKVGGEVVKASKIVRAGDSIDVLTPGGPRVVDVVALSEKRGSAAVAQALYIDRTPPPEPHTDPVARRERGAGRPSKRERRLLIRFRRR